MRINKIEIENINSLKGYWCIDFTHPDYKKNHDLFVICGETGAGKTTLLDAITLALYGRTPRQGPLVSTNEVMTRHTAKCMARVTYECKNGTFISEFSQSKARGKIDGNLVKPSCQIKSLNGEIEYSNLAVSTLAEKTTEIIQLDYTQFCRSIMLAQGEFSNFIMGTERERADILAKLNGTEIYKKIGAAVCSKASAVAHELEMKKVRKDEIKVLSDEEVENLKKEKSDLEAKAKELSKKNDELAEVLNWVDKKEAAEKSLQSAQKERTEFEEKQKAFEEKKIILQKAEKARNCDSEYKQLCDKRKKIEADKISISASKKNLEVANENFESAEKEFALAKEKFVTEKNKSEVLNKKWDAVKNLDFQIEPKIESVQKLLAKKNEAEKELSSKKQAVEKIKTQIESLKNEIDSLEKYLFENKKDKAISEKLGFIKSKKDTLKENINIHTELEQSISKCADKISDLEQKLATATSEQEKINLELKDLVSTEFLSISKLLRNQLKEGSPCPVCGSINHPSCTDSPSKENNKSEKTSEIETKVGTDVAALHKKLEVAEKLVNELTNDLNASNAKKQDLEKSEKEAWEKIEKTLLEINEILSDWNLVAAKESPTEESVEKIEEFIVILENKAQEYSEKEEILKSETDSLRENEAEIKTIDIEKLEKEFKSAEKEHSDEAEILEGLKAKRIELFGEKDVEEEKSKYQKFLEKLEADADEIEEKKNAAEKQKDAICKEIEISENGLAELEKAAADNQKAFDSVLAKNDFASEEEFVRCNVSQEEFENLDAQNESLKTENTKTEADLNNAKSTFEALAKENKTSKSKEELTEEKQAVFAEHTECTKNAGAIGDRLNQNAIAVENGKAVIEEYNAALEEKVLWDEMRSIIGKADGSDFEVFVQALAFKRLINKANKYVFAISGKFELVQIEGKVDFLVHDINFPDSKEDRPISNMSGGEKFIISLSLALGIAELASENVQVDSLFLDEGFGTLSGNPLTEAINALKQLQNSGKMLGIITHVDAVINEFDQRITAVKKNGGISELEGSGITRV